MTNWEEYGRKHAFSVLGNSFHTDTSDCPRRLHCIQSLWRLQILHSFPSLSLW